MNIGSNRRLSLNVLNIYQKNKTTVQYGAGTPPRPASRSMNYGIATYTESTSPDGMVYRSDSDESSSDKSKTWRIPGIPSIPQLADFSCYAVRRTLPRE